MELHVKTRGSFLSRISVYPSSLHPTKKKKNMNSLFSLVRCTRG